MRSGFVGAMLAWAASAGLAWGQYPQNNAFGTPTVIPPPIPGAPFSEPGANPSGTGPDSPPPANWDGYDLNGPAGGTNGAVPRWWINAEYLLWNAKSASYSAPLATTSSTNDAGIIGNTTTQVIYGAGSIPFGLISGFRVSGGFWCDQSGRLGFMAEGFDTGSRGKQFVISTNDIGSPLLARPFINNQNGVAGSYIVAQPGVATGAIYNNTSLATGGGDLNMILNLYRSSPEHGMGYALSLLTGIRFMSLSEHVDIESQTSYLNGQSATFDNQTYTALFGVNSTVTTRRIPRGGGILANVNLVTTTQTDNPVNVNIADRFQTRNNFYGGNLGLYQQFNFGRWSIGLNGSLGIGDMVQTVDVSGASALSVANNITTTVQAIQQFTGAVLFNTSNTASNSISQVQQGGLYAQRNSIGHYTRNEFAVVPEVDIKLAYAITPAITGYVGYNLLYMSSVVRASNLYNSSVNPSLQSTSPSYGSGNITQPFNAFPTSDFWIQGVNFGLNFRY